MGSENGTILSFIHEPSVRQYMMTSSIENFPAEILMKILGNLPFKDLLNASSLSRTFYFLATDSMLWKTFNPNYHIKPATLLEMLQLNRFRRLEIVHLCQEESKLDAELVVRIFNSFKDVELKHLTIQHFDLTSLSSSLLSRTVNNIENVYINHCTEIRNGQLSRIVKEIPEHGRMKGLQVEDVRLSRLEPKSLNRAVNSLINFHSINSDFSREQLKEIFTKMASNTNLKDVSLIGVEGLEEISPVVLAKALNNLESVYVGHCTLSVAQMLCFFEQLANNSTLKKIHFVLNDINPNLLAHIPSDILCKALTKLDAIVLPDIMLSTKQLKNILEGIAKSSSTVKRLDLGNDDIPEVSMEVMRILVDKLEANSLTDDLREKMIEKNEEELRSLKKELLERQLCFRAKMNRLQKKVLALKRMQLFAGSSILVKKQRACKVHVQLVKKSKFSSAYRFAAKSRIVKKSNIGLKFKVVSK